MKKKVPPEAIIIGRNLKALRKIRRLSQADLAEILGVTFQQVQKYERGINRLPIDKLCMAKETLNVPYDFFFEGVGEVEGRALEDISQEIGREANQLLNRNALLDILSLVHTFQRYEADLYAKL